MTSMAQVVYDTCSLAWLSYKWKHTARISCMSDWLALIIGVPFKCKRNQWTLLGTS